VRLRDLRQKGGRLLGRSGSGERRVQGRARSDRVVAVVGSSTNSLNHSAPRAPHCDPPVPLHDHSHTLERSIRGHRSRPPARLISKWRAAPARRSQCSRGGVLRHAATEFLAPVGRGGAANRFSFGTRRPDSRSGTPMPQRRQMAWVATRGVKRITSARSLHREKRW
jgi:hypothetical protein